MRDVTVEIGVRLPDDGDLGIAAESALRMIEAMLAYGTLPEPGTLTLGGLQVRRGSPGDRWAALTDDELRSIMAVCHAATGERLAAFEHWRIADEVDAELERRRA